ncbi:MAG TPA: sulfatase-like hydrolase/transferase [Candidatus Binatia bacterium]
MAGSAEAQPGLGRNVLAGVAGGLVAGAAWWAVESLTNWALGGVVPANVALMILELDLLVAAIAGCLLGLVLTFVPGGVSAPSLALGLTMAFGLIRIFEPPGMGSEAVFVALATVSVVLGTRLAGDERRGPLAFLHLTLLTTTFTALGKAVIGEAQSDYFSKTEPSGLSLALLLAALPLAAVVVDRVVAFLLRRRVLRFALEVAIGLGAAVLWNHWSPPLWTAPIDQMRTVAEPPPAGTPNVLLIALDTTRADHLSTYGYARETSPHLTALAKDALNFTQARSPAQWTVPGHASMFTGMYPSRHGAHYAGDWASGPKIYGRKRVLPLPEDRTTLAEVLRDRGYVTGGFAANFANLDRGFGMAQGFMHYEDHPGLLFRPVPHVVRFVQRFRPAFCKKPFRSAQEINEAALDWLGRVPEGRPFFVFLNYLEPHHWLAPPPYDLWSRDLPHARQLALKGLFTHKVPVHLTDEEQKFITANYDGQVLAMDAALGELMDTLKARNSYENTLIIVTADHGELLGEHQIVGHGGRMMYEGLLHIPMVVKMPGTDRPRGDRTDRVQLVDVLPTVLATIGAPMPEGVQGEPVQHVTHETLAEEHINPEFVAQFGDVYNRALRVYYDGPFKLISTSRGDRFLFNLTTDPNEDQNIASQDPQRVAEMEQRLETMMSHMDLTATKVAAAGAPQ